ncbi:MAG: polysaccharide biosynthesis protein [Candidatus Nitronauta litoralis]|uniref:Polysaccharide biosynthesis protein n=1 Tax=Candidatus Nitronauta litoralis TaxID=2705533 RepID=A0A7T0BWD9_9BACT|nr:MAG: polysaccharide biosynthesis protein [Candidatus Nitronauta litoralis]
MRSNPLSIFLSKPHRSFLLVLDLVFSIAALYLAFFLRFDGTIPEEDVVVFQTVLPFLLMSRAVCLIYLGFYNRFWEYSSLEDLFQIVKGVLLSSLVAVSVLFFYNRAFHIPRSILVIEAILAITFLGGSRVFWRFWKERKKKIVQSASGCNTLVIGAGDTGAYLLKYLKKFSSHYRVCCFIDRDPSKWNSQLMGVRVLGGMDKLPEVIQNYEIKEVLVAINQIDSDELSKIVGRCQMLGVKCKLASSVKDISSQNIHINQIRNVEISDLLGRDPVSLDLQAIQEMFRGKTVLVTGAGGSIGSELCSQILEYHPDRLIMVDKGENYLYDLNLKVRLETLGTKTHCVFCSVTNQKKMEAVFQEYRPDMVFHAAAHKHVPLMEENVDEAIHNNIFGTRTCAELSERFGVERFVLVSTDKVVNPTSIMGMTKNICEKILQFKSSSEDTRFITVRFGNVLGSNGSVVRLFKSQIENGGPVTVTHPDMERFFMLIPEAAQLILQAASLGEGGEIFLLDMGKPVKIVDLAKRMIRLSGFIPGKDMEIQYVGLRPGEKLYEELVADGEEERPTSHKKIKRVLPPCRADQEFMERMTQLCDDVGTATLETLESNLKSLVKSSGSRIMETDPILLGGDPSSGLAPEESKD